MAGPKKTTMAKEAEPGETALMVPSDEFNDMMSPVERGSVDYGDAGSGSEDLDNSNIVLPRVTLLQALSKPVTEEMDGAEAGVWWLTPYNRPITKKIDKGTFTPLRLVVVRIYASQRWWTPVDEGGGLICEAPSGDYHAVQPNGLAGAKIQITSEGEEVTAVNWEGGTPTADCRKCVYGLGAAAAASGQAPSDKGGNPWLPKIVTIGEGAKAKRLRVPDKLRAPICTSGLDVLAFVQIPEFQGQPNDVVPAFITFAKSAQPAGKALGGMIKMANAEPAWGRIYELGSKKVENDSGTFYVPTVRPIGYTSERLADKAKELYETAKVSEFRPNLSDPDARGTDVVDAASIGGSEKPPSEDAPAPGDKF